MQYRDPFDQAVKPGALDSAVMRRWARKRNMDVPRRGPVPFDVKWAFMFALYQPNTAA